MEICTGCAADLSAEAVKHFFRSVKRSISYVVLHEEKLKNLEKKVGGLEEKRDRVQKDVLAAERNGEKIHKDVETWLSLGANIINAELNEVEGLKDKAKKKCFIGLCPNFKARYQLSKKAEEDARAVDELLQRAGEFNKVSYREVPEPIAFAAPKDFEAFDSRKQVLNEIVEVVKDPSINIIGVYGMAGVGKTTLVKEVVRQVKEDKLFDSVVMAAVTQTPDIKEIQDRIAAILGLKFEEQSTTGRASQLRERLKEKKILVVLDDIWARLDPMEVGIPFGDEHQGCTILLTSRDLNVLSKGMDAKRSFPIGVLEQEEAWSFFKKVAGDDVESPDLSPIATEVAKKCAGLPVAIKALARTLRNEPPFAWEDALRQLNRPSSSNFKGAPAEAYLAIELSYNHLDSEHQQTLLLSCLMGHNAGIQDLLKYAVGLELFHGVSSVKETRNRLLTVVSHLKASCLLLDSYNNTRFDMHDLICDVAISIASKDNQMFVLRHGDVLNDWPDGNTMKNWDKISLHYANIRKLPDQLKCPKPTFFFMGSVDPSMKIPSNFFQEMKNLNVLDLTDMRFPSLPSSISLLANLRTLCLDHSVLGDIVLIGELKNLEILSLLHSDIEMLPKEIGQLTKLKLLDLSGSKLIRIPSGVLCNLSRLEELYMGHCFVRWEAEGHPSEQSNASLAELKALSCLTALDIHIPDAKIIPRDFFFENLQRYNIFIGEAWNWDWVGGIEYSRTVKLKLQTSIGFLNYGIKILLKKAENLHLDEMKDMEILLDESEAKQCFQQLKNLHIQNGAMILYIIKINDAVHKIEFPQLQSLTIQGMPKLISFCSENNGSTLLSPQRLALFDQKTVFPKLEKLKLSSISIERIWLPRGFHSTQNLTSLIIEGCNKLKQVLSYSVVECLQQLQCLEITECKCIQEIISTEEMSEETFGITAPISFPRLNSLKLKGLQKLIGFCHEDYIVEFPSLTILEIEQCPELKEFINKSTSEDISTGEALFNKKVAFPKLEKIAISDLGNVKRIWCYQLHGDSFSKLKELTVEHCDALLNIFSSFMLEVFQRLEILKVTNCASLEEVFQLQVQRLDTKETCVVASQLKQVDLNQLPKLKHVWNNDPNGNISFENLREVRVRECLSLKILFPFSIAKDLLQLERLTVIGCGVEEIISKNIEGVEQRICFQFNKLSFLMLWNLPNLTCFYPGMHTTTWPVLKKLCTYRCGKIKIFGQVESQIQQPLFLIEKVIPQLEEVSFSSDDIAMISDGQFAVDLFCHIKILRITCYHNQSDVFLFCFLQRFYHLETLEVVSCNFKELSPYEGDLGEEKDVIITLPKINKLKLNGVDKIRYLWKEGSPLDHICASLATLEVRSCNSLINLSSASLSFQNLTTLDVWECKEIAELFTSSKAQSLMRLVTMRIRECEMITEVIASEGDEATYEIIFMELKSLELRCLQSLKSFCSGNYTFKFPSLDQVIVSQCPSMKNFCQGALSTPQLQNVQLAETDYKGRWSGDLNAAIEQLNVEGLIF